MVYTHLRTCLCSVVKALPVSQARHPPPNLTSPSSPLNSPGILCAPCWAHLSVCPLHVHPERNLGSCCEGFGI